ncbi:MAG: hypothetical protein E3J72_07265 [Planctomycetota bacterium]|nr:MAG: hypothetical protein E3J72_07265 [Planctomycetota bacterium]
MKINLLPDYRRRRASMVFLVAAILGCALVLANMAPPAACSALCMTPADAGRAVQAPVVPMDTVISNLPHALPAHFV